MSGPTYEFTSEGETQEVITRDEAEALLGASDKRAEELGSDRHRRDAPGPVYRIEAIRGRFRIAHSESEAHRGDLIRANQSARLMPHGRPIFAAVDAMPRAGDAELLVRISDFDLFPDPVASMFSASDNDDNDVPAASDGYDSIAWFGDLQNEPFGGTNADGTTSDNLQYFALDVPGAGESLRLLADPSSDWVADDDATIWIEHVPIDTDGSGSVADATIRRTDAENSDYAVTTGQTYVTAELPSNGTVRVGVDVRSFAEQTSPRELALQAKVI